MRRDASGVGPSRAVAPTAGRPIVVGMGPSRIDPHHPCHLVHRGYTVLVTREDGSMDGERLEGLYDYDTRILSRHVLTVGGTAPERPYATSLASDRWMSVMQVRLPGGVPAGPRLPQDQLSLLLTRHIGSGMHEELRLRNHAMVPWKGVVALELGADFADVQETGGRRQQNGTVDIAWDRAAAVLTFRYQARAGSRRLERGMRVRVRAPAPGASAREEGSSCRSTSTRAGPGCWSCRSSPWWTGCGGSRAPFPRLRPGRRRRRPRRGCGRIPHQPRVSAALAGDHLPPRR